MNRRKAIKSLAWTGLLFIPKSFAQFNFNSPSRQVSSVAASVLTALTAQSLGSARKGFTGSVGFKFTANANMSVTQAGRWVISGNNQTHTVAFFDSSCVSLGSVVVDCNGATPAQYLYGNLSLSLTSGSTYYLLSTEADPLDSFYDADTTVTPTADLTVIDAIFKAPGCTLAGSGSNHAYVPVNFKYT